MTLAALKAAHARVSSIFEYERDDYLQQQLAKPDGWFLHMEHWRNWREILKEIIAAENGGPPYRDDCDGWALAIRGLLWHEYKVPSCLVFCLVDGREGHLITGIAEGWCSDNRFPQSVVSRDALQDVHGYTFVSRSALQTDKDQGWRTV